jgi:hypothetical protein
LYGFSGDDTDWAQRRSIPVIAIERKGPIIMYDPSRSSDKYASGLNRKGAESLSGSILMGKAEAKDYLKMANKLAKSM